MNGHPIERTVQWVPSGGGAHGGRVVESAEWSRWHRRIAVYRPHVVGIGAFTAR